MKDLVYTKKPTDLNSVKKSITDLFESIKREKLDKVTNNFATEGSHFENSVDKLPFRRSFQ